MNPFALLPMAYAMAKFAVDNSRHINNANRGINAVGTHLHQGTRLARTVGNGIPAPIRRGAGSLGRKVLRVPDTRGSGKWINMYNMDNGIKCFIISPSAWKAITIASLIIGCVGLTVYFGGSMIKGIVSTVYNSKLAVEQKLSEHVQQLEDKRESDIARLTGGRSNRSYSPKKYRGKYSISRKNA